MVLILITGGNGDVGVEACKQLADIDEVTKVVITCRSDEKATRTIESLISLTGKDPSFFGYSVLDLTDYSSIVESIKSMPEKVDRLCLNVGGLGLCKMHPLGTTDGMVINTLGHAMLFEKLVESGRLQKGSRVVYVGSEVSHDVYSFTGLLPHYYGKFFEDDIEWAISQTYKDVLTGILPVRAQLGDYKNAKIIGQLYFSHMAKEHPDMHFMTISPGAIGGKDGKGTGFSSLGMFPLNVAMKHAPYLFKWLGVTHDITTGTKRLIDGVLVGEPAWDTGSMVMGKKDGIFGLIFWGAKGDVVDVCPIVPYLNDKALAGKTAMAVRRWLSKWETL